MHRLVLFVALVFASACADTVGYTATATVTTPDLVAVAPGVSVIADYGEPIFYVDGYYWWNYDGGWYRSPYYTGGWIEARPPIAVVRIGNPLRYRHYRPRGYVSRYRPTPSHRIQRPQHRRSERGDRRRR